MLKHLNSYIDFISEKSKNTIKSYKRTIEDFFENYNQLTINNINSFIDSKKSYSSKNIIKSSLKDFYMFLKNNSLIEIEMNFDHIKTIKNVKKLPVFLEPEEAELFINKIIENGNQTHLLAYSIMINLGLRISECLNLKVNNINFKKEYILVENDFSFITKNKTERIVYFNEKLGDLFKDYILTNHLKESDKLFSISVSWLEKVSKKYAKQAGINKTITPHKLRHTAATTALENGANLIQVKEFLGHNSLLITEIYTHVSTKNKKEMANMINY